VNQEQGGRRNEITVKCGFCINWAAERTSEQGAMRWPRKKRSLPLEKKFSILHKSPSSVRKMSPTKTSMLVAG